MRLAGVVLLASGFSGIGVSMTKKRNMTMLRASGRMTAVAMICAVIMGMISADQPVFGQDDVSADVTNPLRLADTSSPRDTLVSFLEQSEDLVAAWRRDNGFSDDVYVALRGLQETLDFSSTAYGSSSLEQTLRILMLREILDRIDLPPPEDVPGDAEVAAGDLQVWTIPGTRIRIRQETEGARAGDYLFSARTTGALDLYYRQVRDLPYKPGAQPLLEDWLASAGQDVALLRELNERLTGIDASSPRSTLEEFLMNVNEAYRVATQAEAALNASPPGISIVEAQEANERASDLMWRAGTAFDLSDVPEARRDDWAIESALLLKEILDRVILPPIEVIPDSSMVAASAIEGVPFRWRMPDLSIEIEQVLEGDRAGEFLFSAETVAGLSETLDALRDLPYRHEQGLRGVWEYRSIAPSPGFHDAYISTPGQFVPSANFLGRVVNALPESLMVLHLDQTRWQWLGLFLTTVVAGLLCYLSFRVTAAVVDRTGPVLSSWVLVLAPVVSAGIVDAAVRFLDEDLNLTGDPLAVILTSGRLIILFLFGWTAWRLCMALAASALSTPRFSKGGVDASLVQVMAGLTAIVAATAIVITGLRDLGVDAIPLLGGLGVGGLAVALAMRPTMENLISGIILFTDKPVREGDFCSFGDMMGTVENIGVRSVRIRGLDRTLISIPNAKFANMDLVNWTKCDRMLIKTTIGLRYETSSDQLRLILVKVREMLHAHPEIDESPLRVRFAGYGESSLNIDIMVYALTRDWNDFFAIREDVFLRIKEIVSNSGTDFALPSQTLYFGKDKGLDEEQSETDEEEIAALRASGNLPFPHGSAERIKELENSLDYPPRGSVDADPGSDGKN
jgi:MscS family membrane protein